MLSLYQDWTGLRNIGISEMLWFNWEWNEQWCIALWSLSGLSFCRTAPSARHLSAALRFASLRLALLTPIATWRREAIGLMPTIAYSQVPTVGGHGVRA